MSAALPKLGEFSHAAGIYWNAVAGCELFSLSGWPVPVIDTTLEGDAIGQTRYRDFAGMSYPVIWIDRDKAAIASDAELLHLAVHELGHALGLTHDLGVMAEGVGQAELWVSWETRQEVRERCSHVR